MKTRSPLRAAAALAALGALALGPVADIVADDGKAQALADGSLDTATSTPATTRADCVDGQAGPYACERMDLLSIVTIPEIGLGTVSDMWGWTDPETGQEWALVTTGIGVAFVDVTDPTEPIVAARMPIQPNDYAELWRDVKVYGDHALVVSEHGDFGMHVFDLTRLRDLSAGAAGTVTTVSADAVYDGFGSAHNIAVNPDTGFAYAVGTSDGDDGCGGGLHMVDVRDPEAPVFAGCFADDGYTHDVQCVVYAGPDADHQGDEICFASNEDTVTIVDVTDKANPVQLARVGYPSAAYTHQGWLTPGQEWFLFGDELDEQQGTVAGTTTYILDVRDLDAPPTPTAYTHGTGSIDHNVHVRDDLVYEANYMAGLRVLRWSDEGLAAGRLEPVAYLDTVPVGDAAEFAGVWTLYPFFDSGTLVASDFNTGLIVARLDPSLRPPAEPTGDGDAMGSGELRGDDTTYDLAFHTRGRVPDGGKGRGEGSHLVLDDADGTVSARVHEITARGAPTGPCGDVPVDGRAFEFRGDGTFNGEPASFRVCVADLGDPRRGDADDDRFVLECLSGCTFTTTGTTDGDRLSVGNIRVVGTAGAAAADEEGGAAMVAVGPAEQGDDAVEVRAFGDDLAPLSGADVRLHLTSLGGLVTELTGVTGLDGTLTFAVDPAGLADVHASVGDIRSN